jgi:hypothetical protein
VCAASQKVISVQRGSLTFRERGLASSNRRDSDRIPGPCRVDDQVEWRELCGIGQAPRLTFRKLRPAQDALRRP